MLNQPSTITPDEINGTGTVDVTQDMDVSWKVSGTSAMTAYQITLYANDTNSTQKYTTGKVTLDTPFWGVNYAGEVQYYTATITAAALSSAGVTNGNTYKMLITQWWSANDSVVQTTASMIIARADPTLVLTAIASPVTAKEYSFSATYTQAQGDTIKWVRWRIAYADDEENPFYDTGNIYGTGQLQVDYDGFLTGTEYAVNCTVETQNGIDVTTGWNEFDVSYTLPTATGTASACTVVGDGCVWVQWDMDVAADGYSVMRQTAGDNRLIKIADVGITAGQLRDYSARSGHTYTYYIFPTGELTYLSQPMVTEPLSVQYWFWTIVEASPTGRLREYSAQKSYIFRYNVSEGSISNNNNPSITMNFTQYPTRQGVSANYATGTLGGYIGSISRDTLVYSDTTAQADDLFALSTTSNALFLIDPKGNFRRIHTAAPTTLQIDHKKGIMPQSMTVSWVETGPTENVHVIMFAGGDYYPQDRVIYTTLALDTSTGALIWTTPDNYTGLGSVLSLSNGDLIQNDEGSFLPATMALDTTTMTVSATLSDS